MEAQKNSKKNPQRKAKKAILKLVLALLVVLILLVVFAVPVFVSSESGHKLILTKINSSLDGQTDFSGLLMSWFKGIRVTDFSFIDGAGQTSVSVKQITTKPRYVSILTGSLSFGETIIDEPKVQINLNAKRLLKSKDFQKERPTGKKVSLPIKKIDLVINDGNLKVTDSKAGSVELSQINCQLKKTIDSGKTKLEGRLDCEYDWAALGTVAAPFLPPGLQIEGQRKLSVNFTSQYPAGQTDKLLPNLNTKDKVALGFERAEYMGLNFGPSELEIQIQNGLLSIAPFTTTVNNGQFNFAAKADFKQEPVLLKTPQPIHIVKNIQINDEMTRKLLMYVNPIFANAVNVRGVANFNCERLAIPLAAGKRNNIEVAGIISMSQIQLEASDLLGQLLSLLGMSMRGQDIVVHPTRFVLQNGRLHYENMQIDIGRTPVNFNKCKIGLDKSLDMTVILPYTLKGTTARVDKETIGDPIRLLLKGTLDKPELDLQKMFEEQLKQELQKQLEKGLKDLFK